MVVIGAAIKTTRAGGDEPYYQLGEVAETDGRESHAVHYYYMALDAQPTFQLARDALKRLGSPTGSPA